MVGNIFHVWGVCELIREAEIREELAFLQSTLRDAWAYLDWNEERRGLSSYHVT